MYVSARAHSGGRRGGVGGVCWRCAQRQAASTPGAATTRTTPSGRAKSSASSASARRTCAARKRADVALAPAAVRRPLAHRIHLLRASSRFDHNTVCTPSKKKDLRADPWKVGKKR
eukprot:279337-Pleurochrysis_carterae.AAC.1